MDYYDRKYLERQAKTVSALKKLYNDAYGKIIAGIPLSRLSPDERFAFERFPKIEKEFDRSVKALNTTIMLYIDSSTREAWDLANKKADAVTKELFENYAVKHGGLRLGGRNDAVPAPNQHVAEYNKFKNRKFEELTLSDRVWNINGTNFKKEIELAVNAAIEKGQSSAELSRDIRKYLNDPDALFRRVRDKDGNLGLSKAAAAYHPGQGVYRSAYKNAMRLARTEINNAYSESEYLNWQDNPTIIGFRIRNSDRVATVCELCKRFDGVVFPKSFRWLGFHVQCMCTAIAVFASDDDIAAYMRGEEINPELPGMPKVFTEYQEKLQTQKEGIITPPKENSGTLYFDPFGIKTLADLTSNMVKKVTPIIRKKGLENYLAHNIHETFTYKTASGIKTNIWIIKGASNNDTEFHIAEKLARSGQHVLFPNQGAFGKGRKNDVYIYDAKTYAQQKVEFKVLTGKTAETLKNQLISGSGQANIIAYDIQSNIKKQWLIEGLKKGWAKDLKKVMINYKGLWYEVDRKKLHDGWLENNLK